MRCTCCQGGLKAIPERASEGGEGLLGSPLGAHTTQCYTVPTWQRGGNVHGHEHGHGHGRHTNPATGRAMIVTLLRGLALTTAPAPVVESGANILRLAQTLKCLKYRFVSGSNEIRPGSQKKENATVCHLKGKQGGNTDYTKSNSQCSTAEESPSTLISLCPSEFNKLLP